MSQLEALKRRTLFEERCCFFFFIHLSPVYRYMIDRVSKDTAILISFCLVVTSSIEFSIVVIESHTSKSFWFLVYS
jgi:hypothetical protein